MVQKMLWSLPKLISPRGAGLGNEVFPWAKAYLGARALRLKLVAPPWRVNPRRYDQELETGALDSIKYFALRGLPAVDINAEMIESAQRFDYFEAVTALAPTILAQKRISVLHSSGMHGGYLGIRRSRAFLRREIFGAAGAMTAVEEMDGSSDVGVRIGVHIRGGDFSSTKLVRPAVFNEQLPLDWYVDVVQSLAKSLSVPSFVYLATDTPSPVINAALTVAGCPPRGLALDSVGDLAVLARCDVIISSVSSFSMLAIFLSDASYVWHEDQLGEADGWLSIWGHEALNSGGGRTAQAMKQQSDGEVRVRRGVAQGKVPKWRQGFLNQLEYRARARRSFDDLIFFGVTEGDRRS
ncbi:hypothetical protein [Cryobacterium sp. TMT2-42-4]|uniref:hypothetical protein n=1 Tax=Cryobacterium sp. TMT2-42-4 TaxID=1259255 RepID=UPI00106BF5EC|nr:hypothetical protein [Cryobacterium sp. TMT2-42-4]TFC33954.1 hypothetical protein E3O18_12945 [Cryobacterium sp. TMT2-42-4]